MDIIYYNPGQMSEVVLKMQNNQEDITKSQSEWTSPQ